MTRTRRLATLISALVTAMAVVFLAAGTAGSAPATAPAAAPALTVPVTGTFTGTPGDAFGGAGTLAGTLSLTRVQQQGGSLAVVGTLTGTLMGVNGVVQQITTQLTLPLQVSGTCQILQLTPGPATISWLRRGVNGPGRWVGMELAEKGYGRGTHLSGRELDPWAPATRSGTSSWNSSAGRRKRPARRSAVPGCG